MKDRVDKEMFMTGYRAGSMATSDLSEEENQSLVRPFKAGFVHRRAERAALTTGSASCAVLGRDAALRAGLCAGDFVPYVEMGAARDWAEVLEDNGA